MIVTHQSPENKIGLHGFTACFDIAHLLFKQPHIRDER